MPNQPQSQGQDQSKNVEPTGLKSNANPYGEKPNAVPGGQKAEGSQENEGEGSRSAARNYDRGVEQTVKGGHVEESAKKAEAALDGAEGDELRAAEKKAKATRPEPSEVKKN